MLDDNAINTARVASVPIDHSFVEHVSNKLHD
jgi:hypothetical protein